MEDIECFRCPYCVGCNECGDFKKILELKEAGLVIYRHTITSDTATTGKVPEYEYRPEDIAAQFISNIPSAGVGPMSEFNNAIIMLNTGNCALTIDDFFPEFENKLISCPRCRFIMEHTKLLLKSIPVINKSGIIGVCNLCKLKQQRSRTTCKVCEEIVAKFSKAKNIDDRSHNESQTGKQKEFVEKRFLLEGEHLKKSSRTQYIKQGICRAYSEFAIDKIKIDDDQPLSHTKVDYLFPEAEVTKPIRILDSSAYISDEDRGTKRLIKTKFKENIMIEDKFPISGIIGNKVPMKPIIKKSPLIKPSSISPYHYGDMAASSEKDDSTKLRRCHSDESLISSLSYAVNDELLKKQFKFFFPHMIQRAKDTIAIGSKEILKRTQDKLKAESDEKLRIQTETRIMQEEKEQKKKTDLLTAEKAIAIRESKTVKESKSKETRGSETPTEDITPNIKIISKQSTADKDKFDKIQSDAKVIESDIIKDRKKGDLFDTDEGKKSKGAPKSQFENRNIEKQEKEPASKIEKEKGLKHEGEYMKEDLSQYIDQSKKTDDQILVKKIVPDRQETLKTKSKEESERQEKTDRIKTKGKNEAESKQEKEKQDQSTLEKSKRDEIIATKPGKILKDQIPKDSKIVKDMSNKDKKQETKQKDTKLYDEDQIKKQPEGPPKSITSKKKEGSSPPKPTKNESHTLQLISKDTKREPSLKVKEASEKVQKVEVPALTPKDTKTEPTAKQKRATVKEQKVEETNLPSRDANKALKGTQIERSSKLKEASEKGQKEAPSSILKEPQAKQKEAATKEQKLEVGTKKESALKVKEVFERGHKIEVPSSLSKEPQAKQKEAAAKEQKLEIGTKKEPALKVREISEKGQKFEEPSSISKKLQAKQKEAAAKEQKLEVGTKKEPALKVKEVSEKGQKFEAPSSISKETQPKQKDAATKEQKLEVGAKKEPALKVKEVSEKGQKLEEPSSMSKDPQAKQKEAPTKEQKLEVGTKKEPALKVREVSEKGQKLEEPSSMSKVPQAKQKEAAAKEQKLEVGTKKEPGLKVKEVSVKGQKIEVPSSMSKDPQAKQKESPTKEQKLEVGTKKEPALKVREVSEKGQKLEEPSSMSKVPQAKQKEAAAKEQKLEVGTKKEPALKEKEISVKGNKIDEPSSISKEPQGKQKEAAAKEQKLEVGTKKEPALKEKEISVKGNKIDEPSSISKEPQGKQKEAAAKEQKLEVSTKKEPALKEKEISVKGKKIDEPSSISKEPQGKQKEAAAKEQKLEVSTKKEPALKEKEISEKGKKIDEPSSMSKEPQGKQKETAAKEQKLEVGTKKEPALKEKEISEKGKKIEVPSSISKEPQVKQKEAAAQEQKLEAGTKKEPLSKVKEASEKGHKIEVPSSFSKETKKEISLKEQQTEDRKLSSKDTKKELPSKLNEATGKDQKAKESTSVSKEPADKQTAIKESLDSKTTKKLPPPPPLPPHKEQKLKQGSTKEEVNLLNKSLAQKDKDIDEGQKMKQAQEEQQNKNKVVTEKTLQQTLPLPDPLKLKPVSTENKKEPQETKKEQNQKAKQQGPVVDIKNIKVEIPQDDLITKLITIRNQAGREDRTLKTQSLPEVPVKRRLLRKKQSLLSLESSIISDKGIATPTDELVFGKVICKNNEVPVKLKKELQPSLFKSVYTEDRTVIEGRAHDVEEMKLEPVEDEVPQGVIRYALSDRKYIENGWTILPTEKIVRKLNIYRMRPAHPEFDWFKYNKSKGAMQYDSGEKLAEFDDNGRGRWYYRNGRIALDYYDSEDINAQQRIVLYSSGDPDERARSCPVTILGVFDYMGNGVVFDHRGKIRLKYTQDEGVVLDRSIGPTSHWKWHSLNDPPELQQVMMDTQMPYPDPTIMQLEEEKEKNKKTRDDTEMLHIEFENYAKEKLQKTKDTFHPYQIKMKALKINSQFSLRILDQASIYLLYRDGTTTLKLNLGMVLDQNEIVNTGMADVGQVACAVEKVPTESMSLAMLQHDLDRARRCDRAATERERRVRRPCTLASADCLVAPLSRPLRLPPGELSNPSLRIDNQCQFKYKKPQNCCCNLYYDNRLI